MASTRSSKSFPSNRIRVYGLIFTVMAGLMTACSPSASHEQAETPSAAQNASLYPLIIRTQDNTAHLLQIEVARTPHELAQGLMFRHSLQEDAGMLFLFPETHVYPAGYPVSGRRRHDRAPAPDGQAARRNTHSFHETRRCRSGNCRWTSRQTRHTYRGQD